jgi:hypothetical protein
VTAALATIPVPMTAANQLGPSTGRVVLFAVGDEGPADVEEFMTRTLWAGWTGIIDHVQM